MDMKDEISFWYFWVNFLPNVLLWFENLSSLCKLIVSGSQTLRSNFLLEVRNRYRGFQNIGLPSPVFTVENSAANNPIHTAHSESVHTRCTIYHYCRVRWLLDPLNCTMWNLRNSEWLWVNAKRWLAPNEFRYRKIEQLIPITNGCLTIAVTSLSW